MAGGDRREGGRGLGFLARYLASKAGARYLLKIKAAKEWGYSPTSLILGKQKSSLPTKWDLLLAEAEKTLEMERCPQCGNPRWVCQSDDSDIDFRVYDETCNAMRKKQQQEEKNSKKKGDRSGIIVGVEAYTHSDTPLVEFREPFYLDKERSRAASEEGRVVRPREHPPGWTPESDES